VNALTGEAASRPRRWRRLSPNCRDSAPRTRNGSWRRPNCARS
jgi:hypothetical protein